MLKLPSLPPSGWNAEEFFAGRRWFQQWELFAGVLTPGLNQIAQICDWAKVPKDLTGKRVLDIGALHGCASFECERRGASEVVALSLEDPEWIGFNRLKAVLHSSVRYVQSSAYTLDPQQLGQFDVILFFGVLYHLRYPLLAVDRIRTVARGSVHIETHLTTSSLLVRKPWSYVSKSLDLLRLFRGTPIWRQYRGREIHPTDQSNWFGPNVQAVIESFESAGFDIEHCRSWGPGGERGTFRATVRPELPERLTRYTYEGWSPLNSTIAGLPENRRPGF